MKPTKTINIDFAQRVAVAYENMEHNPTETKVKQAYKTLAFETVEQYKMILDSGITIEFDFKHSLYKSPDETIRDIVEYNHLYVFSTVDGFGSNEDFKPDGNPLLNHSGFSISGKPAFINDLFRVIHDYFGHYKGQNGFDELGEENAYRYHCKMFSPLAVKALTSELRGQSSWVNHGPYGEQNRNAKPGETIFADQKTGLLPDFCLEEY